MVKAVLHPRFEKIYSKIKDKGLKERIEKQLIRLKDNPEIGKPMKNVRKGTREIYVSPYRLSYVYLENEDKIVLLDFYHKDEQ